MILSTILDFDHIALCIAGALMARRDPELFKAAVIYTACIALFSVLAKEPSHYGRSWYAVCAGVELAIVGCLWGIDRAAAKIVIGVSLVNIIAHLAFYNRWWSDRDWYTSLVTTGEYAQAGFIILMSPPAVNWGRRRLARKKEHSWLARASISIG